MVKFYLYSTVIFFETGKFVAQIDFVLSKVLFKTHF